MATRVTMTTLDDGRLAVDKVQLSGDLADRRGEAKWLAGARSRSVVHLLSTSNDPFTIRTLHAGATTIRTGRPDSTVAAAVLTDAAIGLADLHERNMVHGALTLDHIIVDGRRAVLCSPTGTATDPTTDVQALGACMSALIDRWHEEGVSVARRSEWVALAGRLCDADAALTARRAARALARLAAEPEAAPPAELSRSTRRQRLGPFESRPGLGIVLLLVVLVAALAGLWLAPDTGPRPSAGALIEIGGATFDVGSVGDTVLVIPEPCRPRVVYFDNETDTVWLFDEPGEGAVGTPLARVPGATTLETTEGRCDSIVAVGPAGRTEVSL